jgi:hypothetical protein
LARTVPGGFGGYFVRSSDGRETIYLKEPEKRGEALVALNARPVTGVTIGADVVVVRGRWDYVQLYEWYRYLVPRLSGTRLVSTDLDEGENRILLGVEDEPSRRRLERRLAALDVPCFLVAIEVGPPPRSVFRRAAAAKTAAAPAGGARERDEPRDHERDVHDARERFEHHERARHRRHRHDVAQPHAREHGDAAAEKLHPAPHHAAGAVAGVGRYVIRDPRDAA